MSDLRGLSPNEIDAVRFAEDLYNIRPRQQPELPLVVPSDLARGEWEHQVIVANPVESGVDLGSCPNSDTTIWTDPDLPQSDFTLGCREVNDFKQQYGIFGNYTRQISNTINEGNQRGDNVGLYTTPIHRIFGPVMNAPNFWDGDLATNEKLYKGSYN